MNFSQIKCFLAAADCLSFTKAADRLYLSQPVLSRQIASMEDELGMELFIREKKSVRLTPAGEVLSEGLRQLSNDYRALLDRANAMHMGYSGNVNLGLIEGQLICPPVSDVLMSVHKKYPDLRVNLTKHTMAGLKKAITNGEIDIGFTAQFDIRKNEGFESMVVGKTSTYLVIPKSHPLANKEGLTMADFKDSTFLSLSESESSYMAKNSPAAMGMKTLEAPNIGTLALWLEAGYGIFPLNGNHQLRNNPNLLFVPMPELGDTNEIILWREDNKNPALPLLIDEFALCADGKRE
ncbi:MAG: LysR family transcriptional regulator [Oscillospiraceae bacterium]|nr:LysR family transcriptional regulator [Oscillospiraceae bacterium]